MMKILPLHLLIFLILCWPLMAVTTPAQKLSPQPPSTQASVIVDQLAATVNGEAITQSELLWGLALLPSVKGDFDSKQNLSLMLNQLIDQRLLLGEAQRLPSLDPSDEELNKAIADLIKQFPSETIFRERAISVGLTVDMLREIVRQRLLILKYIDFRFRAFAVISEAEIQRYFKEVLVPQLEARGVTPPETLSERERNLIESNLIEDRINREIDEFIENARRQADVVVLAQY